MRLQNALARIVKQKANKQTSKQTNRQKKLLTSDGIGVHNRKMIKLRLFYFVVQSENRHKLHEGDHKNEN